MESYKHRFAKNVLAGWLLKSTYGSCDESMSSEEDGWEVATEYPVCIDAKNKMLGAPAAWAAVPSYSRCLERGLLPLVIFDVAVIQNSQLKAAYEILHTNDVSADKDAFIRRIRQDTPWLRVHSMRANWVLQQPKRPSLLLCTAIRSAT